MVEGARFDSCPFESMGGAWALSSGGMGVRPGGALARSLTMKPTRHFPPVAKPLILGRRVTRIARNAVRRGGSALLALAESTTRYPSDR